VIARFQGVDGKRLLVEAIRAQTLVCDEEALASALADAVSLEPVEASTLIICQGAADNDLFFIIDGELAIEVNGREVARRGPGQHVGELALIDPHARRSATVVARRQSLLARIPEAAFSAMAESYPRLWRRIAIEVGERLRQRGDLVPVKRERPELFIGSSKEGLTIAREIQSALRYDAFTVRLWTDRVFGASHFPLEDLETQLKRADFAALLCSPDDHVTSRGYQHEDPRDNIVFELGPFMGALGRHRTLVMAPRGSNLKLPTDLLGLNRVEYATGDPTSLAERVAPLCHDVRRLISELGTR